MAVQLIEQLSGEFDISKYKDTYSDKLMKLIKAKAKGKKIAPAQLRVVHSPSRDLMAQLKASLEPAKREGILSKLKVVNNDLYGKIKNRFNQLR